jgi:GT2 family glycosyltransferase
MVADVRTNPMSEGPKTTAVVVTYNSSTTIDPTLAAARAACTAGELAVVVVDNASTDGTADQVRRQHPWVEVVASPRNVGFARGCNLGARRASTPYVLFLNPDAILERDALATLVRFMDENPGCGAVGPAIRYPDGTLQHAGDLLTPGGLVRAAIARRPGPERTLIRPGGPPFVTDWLCGAVFFTRLQLFRELGGMDPRFFLYFEETDLCLRIRRAGHSLCAVGSSVATHEGGASTRRAGAVMDHGCLPQHYYPSRFYYLAKHNGYLRAAFAESIALAAVACRAAIRSLLRRPGDLLRTRLRGGFLRAPTHREDEGA